MKKTIRIFVVILFIVCIFSSCKTQKQNDSQEITTPIVTSVETTEISQNEIPVKIKNPKICCEIDKFLNSNNYIESIVISDFNSRGIIFNYNDFNFYTTKTKNGNVAIETMTFVSEQQENIISQINIGTPIKNIYSELGEPDVTDDKNHILEYYLDGYCCLIYGEQNVEIVSIAKMPKLTNNYENLLNDFIQIFKNENAIENIKINYPLYTSFYDVRNVQYIIYPNGIIINRTEDGYNIQVYENYYTDWTEIVDDNIIYNSSDIVMQELIQYLQKQNSEDWIKNDLGEFSAFSDNDCDFINARILIRNENTNQITIVKTNHYAADLYWLNNNVLIYNVYLGKAQAYDCKTNEYINFDNYCNEDEYYYEFDNNNQILIFYNITGEEINQIIWKS